MLFVYSWSSWLWSWFL